MRLTVDLILSARSFTNAIKDRQIDLRGYKIAIIENIGATQDQFDAIDLSDNEIRKLDNFSLIHRCHTLFLNNNRINRISDTVAAALPNLTTLVLSNNLLAELSDLHNLSTFSKLSSLSLLGNPVTKLPNYRLYVIHILPKLKLLDFRKIRPKERELALKMFGTFKPVVPVPVEGAGQPQASEEGLTTEQILRIKNAIAEAKSLEEISSLERALKLGIVPESLNGASEQQQISSAVMDTD
eukprot:c2639_g1_i2.p1 GENE.c2639_g1_i2~~c2639_g1_i2.p1  ORF type:complete len:256 (+),score=62.12 c2639_g1_i2:50-769(+)